MTMDAVLNPALCVTLDRHSMAGSFEASVCNTRKWDGRKRTEGLNMIRLSKRIMSVDSIFY